MVSVTNDRKGILVRIITNLSLYPTCIAMNARGTIIACSCDDNCIYFFSVFSRTLLRTIYAHSNTITSLELAARQLVNGRILSHMGLWKWELHIHAPSSVGQCTYVVFLFLSHF